MPVGSKLLKNLSVAGLQQRLRNWFPEREFFMRSGGQVRFIRISPRLQMTAAGIVTALLLAWLLSMAGMAIAQYSAARNRLSLLDREAKVATSESRVSAYRGSLDKVAGDLTKRQDFIEDVTRAHLGDLPADSKAGETVSDSTTEAARTVDKVSVALPEAAGLAQMEARQLAFVERLTRYADRRAATDAERLRKVGLNPGAMLTSLDDRSAQGGPFLRLSTSSDGSIDPRFQRLGLSLARMEALVRGVQSLPQVLPASFDYISSGFGFRSDPFTGAGSFHPGLDFKGPLGASIYAAAPGRVSFVGQRSGYGNCIEIDHGNGLVTRYAHMSGFRTAVGTTVRSGDVIGLIGSTGRSTGPHLHFEVRLHDQAINPRPFLEAATHVFEKTGGSSASDTGPAHD